MQFRAAVLNRVREPLIVETLEARPLQPHDVLIRVRATSLCHTDLEVIEGQLAYPLPIVLGHEAAGVVEAVGCDVSQVKPGDHVIPSWNPSCGQCFYCCEQQPILCETYTRVGPTALCFDGTARLDRHGHDMHNLMFVGSFAEYCVVTEQCAIRIPREIPFDRACLIGCAVMTGAGAALRIAQVRYGTTALVIGCGAVGLSAVQGARLAGADKIIAVDLDDEKLALACRLGATQAVNAGTQDAVEAVRSETAGRGADYVFEAAGNEHAFRTSVEAVRPGGQVVWLGKVNVDRDVSLRWGSLMGEKRIVRSSYGGARAPRDFPLLAQAYLDGNLYLDELISRRISLDEINDGFTALKKGAVVRAVVMFPD